VAIFHLSAAPIQRSKGHSAVAAAAYRAGERLEDRRMGELHDYQRKQGIVASEIIAPDSAPAWVTDREELWNRAEAIERQHNGQPAREVRLALPAELTDEQRADLVFNFCRDTFVAEGMVADVSIHRPDRHGDDRNHHAHILLTMRELEGEEFAKRKQREWNKPEMLQGWREQWAAYQNAALEEAGFDERVDHRSLIEQGITDRLPEQHHGKGEHIERAGGESDRVHEIKAEAELYQELQAERQALDEELEVYDWQDQKETSQSAFSNPVNEQLSQDMEAEGEVSQYWVAKHWIKNTLEKIENFFHHTGEIIRNAWDSYVLRRDPHGRENSEPELDKEGKGIEYEWK
jgi:hypothetical protein